MMLYAIASCFPNAPFISMHVTGLGIDQGISDQLALSVQNNFIEKSTTFNHRS